MSSSVCRLVASGPALELVQLAGMEPEMTLLDKSRCCSGNLDHSAKSSKQVHTTAFRMMQACTDCYE